MMFAVSPDEGYVRQQSKFRGDALDTGGEPLQRNVEMRRIIDANRGLRDLLVYTEFGLDNSSELDRARPKQPWWRGSFVSGSTTAYSQWQSSSTRITVSSTAIQCGAAALVG